MDGNLRLQTPHNYRFCKASPIGYQKIFNKGEIEKKMRIYSDRIHIGSPTHVGPLTVFPVWSEHRSKHEHIAYQPEGFDISELSQANVETLEVRNTSDHAVLIPQGTLISGGLQTRVLEREVLVESGQYEELAVRCVEAGRWGEPEDAAFDGRVPAPIIAVLRGIGPESRINDRQQEVWSRVSRYEFQHGRRNTGSFQSIRDQVKDDLQSAKDQAEANRINRSQAMIRQLSNQVEALARTPLPGQNGILIGLSGQPIHLEVFGSEASFRAQVSSLLNAALVDIPFATEEPTPLRRAIRFAEAVMDEPMTFDSSGHLMRARTSRIDSQCLVPDSMDLASIHMSVINPRHELVVAL